LWREFALYFKIYPFVKMETNKLFVGNLSWNLRWQDLKDIFKEFGEVAFVRIVTDRETGRSKGFGFVEFTSVEEAAAAKEAMDGKEIDGRELRIDFAQEREEKTEA
jgi:RNA recognition motif-containing protein